MAERKRRRNLHRDDVVVLSGDDTLAVLESRELTIVDVVSKAYQAHARGDSVLPGSTFLRFPESEKNRIIALPAYLGDGFSVAGMKWIASFPANLERGMERASAVVVLNSTETGRPLAILEGSVISAKRTAASAALAARALHDGPAARVGVIGCGLISFESVRFLLATLAGVDALLIFDTDSLKAQAFKARCASLPERIAVEIAPDLNSVVEDCPLVLIATTATTPHVQKLTSSSGPRTILHVSLRDFAPEVILECDNVVDSIDHVFSGQTSLHLAEQISGRRDFVRCTIGDLLLGRAAPRDQTKKTTMFSPFGLGILDVALASYVFEEAADRGLGTVLSSFFPRPWTERTQITAASAS